MKAGSVAELILKSGVREVLKQASRCLCTEAVRRLIPRTSCALPPLVEKGTMWGGQRLLSAEQKVLKRNREALALHGKDSHQGEHWSWAERGWMSAAIQGLQTKPGNALKSAGGTSLHLQLQAQG